MSSSYGLTLRGHFVNYSEVLDLSSEFESSVENVRSCHHQDQ